MSTYLDHVNRVLLRLRQDPISDLSTDTLSVAYRVQFAVQQATARVWNAKQWRFKQRKTTLALTSGTSDYNLARDIDQPYLVLLSASPYLVRQKSEDDFDTRVPNPTATGNPDIWTVFENRGVEVVHSVASRMGFVSSSASDTTQQILVRGIVNGVEDQEAITLNGLSTVLTIKTFSKVTALSKSADTAGKVSVIDDIFNQIAFLGPLERVFRVRRIRFYPTPASSLTATIKYFQEPVVPVHKLDDTQIPGKWDYVVDQWAFALALQPQGQDQLNEQTVQFQLAEKFLNEDMAGEENQNASALIQPRRAADDATMYEGYLRSATDGLSLEEGY